MVWSAVMVESGSSTARKTAITTISIMVVLLASRCRLSTQAGYSIIYRI